MADSSQGAIEDGGTLKPVTHQGPLLEDFMEGSGSSLSRYQSHGGYEEWRRLVTAADPRAIIAKIEAAGLRGRGGGGFPTAIKWGQVAAALSPEKYFVCNAQAGQPGGFKERFLLSSNPHRILEATAIGALAVGARKAFLLLGRGFEEEEQALLRAQRDARAAGLLGIPDNSPEITIIRSSGGYISGEETAALEAIEGRPARPRGKPPMPTRRGLFGSPTAVNNLETILQAYLILKAGPERFRAIGTRDAPGTLLFCVSGDIERPGLYELALGTPLRDLIFQHGQGAVSGRQIKAVLVGGVSSRFYGPDALDMPLDYDSLREAGGDLGSGVVIVVSDAVSGVELARHMARFYARNSCGKCQPCKDGTARVEGMFERLDRLDERSTDLAGRSRPQSPRSTGLVVLQEGAGEAGGISYTDWAKGLDKIRSLAEWYKYRGDCHHSTEAANAVQSMLDLFHDELEAARLAGESSGAVAR